MDVLTIVTVLALLITSGSTLILSRQLRVTRDELEHTRNRMGRLDLIADEYARELERPAAERTHETPIPGELRAVRESGKFTPIGFDFESDAFFDEDDDFAAPRMTQTTDEHDRHPHKQVPSRVRHETPAGTPGALARRARRHVVEVGSIQVNSDFIAGDPDAD